MFTDTHNAIKMQRESGQQLWPLKQLWDPLVVGLLAYLEELCHLELEAFLRHEDN